MMNRSLDYAAMDDDESRDDSVFSFRSLPPYLSANPVTTITPSVVEAQQPPLRRVSTSSDSIEVGAGVSQLSYEATTEKKRNCNEATNTVVASLLGALVKDSTASTASSEFNPRIIPFENEDDPSKHHDASARESNASTTSSSVKPRTIPFGNEDDLLKSQHVFRHSVERDDDDEKGLVEFFDNLLSETQSTTKREVTSVAPVALALEKSEEDAIPASEKATQELSSHEPYGTGQVPSVIDNLDGALNMSGISGTEEGIKVGENAYIAKHAGQGQMILYRVLSKEEAHDMIENKGTFDTESPLLSQCESSGENEVAVMDEQSGKRIKRAASSKLSCKVRAAVCASGLMILVIGLFVGIAVTLFNIDNSQASSHATMVNETEAIASVSTATPTAAPSPFQDEGRPTNNPSVLPPVSLYDAIDLPVYTWEAIANTSSPQAKAFKVLQAEPSLAYYSRQRTLQRFVLRVLYFATNGDGWTQKDSWLSQSVHECEWLSNTCGEADEIQSLVIQKNGLNGSLPAELELLTSLVDLDLSYNHLVGPLPSYMVTMSNLQTLNLTSNQLTSTLPTGIGALSRLTRIGLAENSLSGSLPAQIGGLSELKVLRLYDNEMVGSLPSEIALLTQLRHLELDSNRFEKQIPTEFGLLANLESLWLSNNVISGWIPTELGKLKQLQGLHMQVNSISGLLPSELGKLTEMRELKLFENQLRSAMPTELGLLTNLERLSLGWNSLSGFIFTEVGRLERLIELDLVANDLDGTLPTELGGLSNLEHLWLFSNNIEGTIPTQIGQLSHLDQVLLFWNWLTGPLPSQIGQCSNLKILSLESNDLTKSIPTELGSLSELEWLMLFDNQLSAELPSEIGTLTNLTWLRLEKNMLTGTVPETLASLSRLEHLSLQSTSLTGSIPYFFCDLIEIEQLQVGVECQKVSCDCGCICYT